MTPRSARGYTLLEVVIAFGLLALSLTLLLGILTRSSRDVHWSAEAGRAALLSQSVLDQLDMGGALREGERDGDFDDGRYRWRMRIARWRDPALPPNVATQGAPLLYRVELTMQWGDDAREKLQLTSLRLQQPGLDAQ